VSNMIKILVIEHDEKDKLFIQQVFSLNQGIEAELTFAERCSKAIQLLASNDFDLVLLNLTVPDSYGIRTFEEFFNQHLEIPIIILVHPADEAMALEAVRKGAQDYIIKNELGICPLKRIINCAIERNLLRTKIARMAITDELTGLYNRRGFFILAQQQLELARRLQKVIGFFFLDIDEMKEINDFLGHHEGDQALIDMAQILRESCRATDVIGRIGGDEFAIALIQEIDCIQSIEKRIRNKINLHNKARLRKYMLSVSIGQYSANGQNCADIQAALAQADKMMYFEKKQKRLLVSER